MVFWRKLKEKIKDGVSKWYVDNEIKKVSDEVEQIDQELNTFAKKGLENTFTAKNKFRDDLEILNDKSLKIGWDSNDVKIVLKGGDGNKNGEINAPQGDLKLWCKDGNNILVSNKRIGLLGDATHELDATNKKYVDGIKTNIEQSINQTNAKVGENTNSINVLHQTKADTDTVYTKTQTDNLLTNYYNKSESDNRYQLKGTARDYYTKTESDGKYVQFTLSKPLNANYQSLYNLSNPNNARDAATKEYVDANKTKLIASFTNIDFDSISSGGWYGAFKKVRLKADKMIRYYTNVWITVEIYDSKGHNILWSSNIYDEYIYPNQVKAIEILFKSTTSDNTLDNILYRVRVYG